MRLAFVGAGEVTVRTAEILIQRGHEVIIIEGDKEKIDQLSESLDCSFLHGDGSNPAVLKEVDPEHTDVLFCLSDKDQDNIIASLVGRSLGFHRVITKIEDPEFECICQELNLADTIIPSTTISRFLADMLEGKDILELSTVMKGEARFFAFTVRKQDTGSVAELDVPENARVICFYRKNRFSLADGDTQLQNGDEVVILTHSENLPALQERWQPKQSNDENSQET
jgi:trk system potassium uptake protein TrkA